MPFTDERWWVVGAGIVGLLCFAGGAMTARWPRLDASDEEVRRVLVERRNALLAGTVVHVTGAVLLLWPLVVVLLGGSGFPGWPTVGWFGVLAWVVSFGFLVTGSLVSLGAVWRGPDGLPVTTERALLDIGHLATWAVSAPAAAIAVVATTVSGVQSDLFGPAMVILAALKVATVVIEVVGTGRRTGWNAGGWAAGISGYATVAWFAGLVVAIWRV